MKQTKQERETRNIELVETGNLSTSIRRIKAAANDYQNQRWKRCLYHALAMAGESPHTLQRIREALELP